MKKTIIAGVIEVIAQAASESASFVGLYEPKMPDELVKKEPSKKAE